MNFHGAPRLSCKGLIYKCVSDVSSKWRSTTWNRRFFGKQIPQHCGAASSVRGGISIDEKLLSKNRGLTTYVQRAILKTGDIQIQCLCKRNIDPGRLSPLGGWASTNEFGLTEESKSSLDWRVTSQWVVSGRRGLWVWPLGIGRPGHLHLLLENSWN